MASKGLMPKLWKSTGKVIPREFIRSLTLHEYQSHAILKEYGIPVPRGRLAQTPAEVRSIVEQLGVPCVLKSQILKGGQVNGNFDTGFNSGIQFVNDALGAEEAAKKILSHRLMKTETGGSGLSINKIFVAEDMKLHEEWYLAMTFDRENYCPVIIVRRNDGADVGSIPTNKTQKFHTIKFALTKGVTPDVVDKVSDVMKNSSTEAQNLQTLLNGLYKIFTSKDATLLEVNSLVKSADGTFTCLNTKSTFDDASAKRQKDLFALRDSDHEVPEEVEAEKYGLVYVRMDGNIGNVVNGAGLAMATNDAIALHGGTSANFLDAGGQATKETMVKAFEIILRDTRVKAILVNIYGGITRGDMIAESIIGAATELGPLKVPMVVRLQGTNSELGLKLLEEANLGLHTEADFGRAAQKAVELAK